MKKILISEKTHNITIEAVLLSNLKKESFGQLFSRLENGNLEYAICDDYIQKVTIALKDYKESHTGRADAANEAISEWTQHLG